MGTPNRHSFIPQTCPNKKKFASFTSRTSNISNPPHSERAFNQNRMPKPAYFESNPFGMRQEEDRNVNDVEFENEEIKNEEIDIEEIEHLKLEKERERKQNDRKKKKEEREELIRRNAAKRIEEMKNEKIKERKDEEIKNKLRERIHPEIIQKAHPVKNNPVRLIKAFYPKTRISSNANKKDILKAFKRAICHFHPDKTINKDFEQQIRNEEIFKLLCMEKDKFQNKEHHNFYNPAYHKKQKKGGWFS